MKEVPALVSGSSVGSAKMAIGLRSIIGLVGEKFASLAVLAYFTLGTAFQFFVGFTNLALPFSVEPWIFSLVAVTVHGEVS